MRVFSTWSYSPIRNMLYGVAFVLLVSLLGVAGYMAQGWSLADAV
jgi:hypothetical protein